MRFCVFADACAYACWAGGLQVLHHLRAAAGFCLPNGEQIRQHFRPVALSNCALLRLQQWEPSPFETIHCPLQRARIVVIDLTLRAFDPYRQILSLFFLYVRRSC